MGLTDPHQPISFAAACRDTADVCEVIIPSESLGSVDALRALATRMDEAIALCDVCDAEAGPVGVWSTDSLIDGMKLIRALASGYRPPGQEGKA